MLESQFQTLQHKVYYIVNQYKTKLQSSGKYTEEHMLPVSDSIFCAEDIVRNKKFFLGIHQSIQKLRQKHEEIVVVDAGSGSGIMGLMALSLGADKCYFLELNTASLELSKEVLGSFRYQHQSEFIHCDATKFQMPENFHLLISETLSAGFVEEDFVDIISNLKKYQHEDAIFLPSGFDLTIYEKDQYGQKLTEQKMVLETANIASGCQLQLQNAGTKKITFDMTAKFPGNIEITPGSCLSFLNSRDFSLDDQHPVFEINRK